MVQKTSDLQVKKTLENDPAMEMRQILLYMTNRTRVTLQTWKQKHLIGSTDSFKDDSSRPGWFLREEPGGTEVDGLAVLLIDLHRAPLVVFWGRIKRQPWTPTDTLLLSFTRTWTHQVPLGSSSPSVPQRNWPFVLSKEELTEVTEWFEAGQQTIQIKSKTAQWHCSVLLITVNVPISLGCWIKPSN